MRRHTEKRKMPKLRIPLPSRSVEVHIPKKGMGSYNRKEEKEKIKDILKKSDDINKCDICYYNNNNMCCMNYGLKRKVTCEEARDFEWMCGIMASDFIERKDYNDEKDKIKSTC